MRKHSLGEFSLSALKDHGVLCVIWYLAGSHCSNQAVMADWLIERSVCGGVSVPADSLVELLDSIVYPKA